MTARTRADRPTKPARSPIARSRPIRCASCQSRSSSTAPGLLELPQAGPRLGKSRLGGLAADPPAARLHGCRRGPGQVAAVSSWRGRRCDEPSTAPAAAAPRASKAPSPPCWGHCAAPARRSAPSNDHVLRQTPPSPFPPHRHTARVGSRRVRATGRRACSRRNLRANGGSRLGSQVPTRASAAPRLRGEVLLRGFRQACYSAQPRRASEPLADAIPPDRLVPPPAGRQSG